MYGMMNETNELEWREKRYGLWWIEERKKERKAKRMEKERIFLLNSNPDNMISSSFLLFFYGKKILPLFHSIICYSEILFLNAVWIIFSYLSLFTLLIFFSVDWIHGNFSPYLHHQTMTSVSKSVNKSGGQFILFFFRLVSLSASILPSTFKHLTRWDFR